MDHDRLGLLSVFPTSSFEWPTDVIPLGVPWNARIHFWSEIKVIQIKKVEYILVKLVYNGLSISWI